MFVVVSVAFTFGNDTSVAKSVEHRGKLIFFIEITPLLPIHLQLVSRNDRLQTFQHVILTLVPTTALVTDPLNTAKRRNYPPLSTPFHFLLPLQPARRHSINLRLKKPEGVCHSTSLINSSKPSDGHVLTKARRIFVPIATQR